MKTVRLVTHLRASSAERRCSANTKSALRNAARYLEGYEDYIGREVMSSDFDYLLVEAFFAYMRQTYELRHNTVIKIVQVIVSAVNRLKRDGYDVGRDYADYKMRFEESTTVALSDDEIERLYRLALKGQSEIIRDLFVIACETGLRYSDLVSLQDNNVRDNILTVRTHKTGVTVCIPLRHRVRDIIAKHGGVVKYRDSQTNFNKCVKTLCKKAGVKDKVLCEYTQGTRIVRKSIPKYKLVSSHTGRRSFATNAYFSGIPIARIMLITGHRTEEAFFRYIRIGKKENAVELSRHPFFL